MALPTSAVARYARAEAQLPSFAEEPWYLHAQQRSNGTYKAKDPVIRVVATSKVTGNVLPRSEDVWLALLPFDDLAKKKPKDAVDLLAKRVAFVELLVRLAASKRFGWHVPIFCGEDLGPLVLDAQVDTFWFSLFAELSQEWKLDTTMELERNLTVLTRQRVPRFLLCFTQSVASLDFPHLLDVFLSSAGVSDLGQVAAKFDLTEQDLERFPPRPGVVIELGLRFTKGKFTEAVIAGLLDVVQHASTKGTSDLKFMITTLHFGRLCTFHPKALELLCRRRGDCKSLVKIRLGSLQGVRPASLRSSLTSLLRSPTSLHRLATCTDESFPAFASALRYGEKSSVEELDVVFTPTLETAKWLAFGLFHADSKSKVSSLRLRIPFFDDDRNRASRLTTEWIEVFKRVLLSVRAEYDLADMESEDTDDSNAEEKAAIERVFVKLQRRTPLKNHPYSGAKVLIKLEDDDEAEREEFELIVRVKNSVAFIAPGFGVGWVPATSVLSERSMISALAKAEDSTRVLSNDRIKSFAWDAAVPACRDQRVDEMLELLKIIGKPLECLDLPRMNMTTANLARLLKLCPNLTELNVSGHNLASIQPLVDAYATGNCKISALSIARRSSAPYTSVVPQNEVAPTIPYELLHLLQAQASGGGGPLRQLVIDSQPRPHHEHTLAFYEQELKPLVAALDRCKRIDFVHLASDDRYFSHDGLETEPYSVHALPLRHKLAFLSVVDHHTSDLHRPLGLLDASVLGGILGFCSELVPRRGFVSVPLAFERKECSCSRCMANGWHVDHVLPNQIFARTVW